MATVLKLIHNTFQHQQPKLQCLRAWDFQHTQGQLALSLLKRDNAKSNNPFSPFHPPDQLRQIINHGETQVSREISHLSTQITQLSPRLIL